MTAPPTLVVAYGNAATIWDYSNAHQQEEEGIIHTFYPHGEHDIADICWNHNGQVLASCSRVNTDDMIMAAGGQKHYDNVVLTETNSGGILDSLQHNREWNTAPLYRRAGICTSVAFGGKSRYLCLGDTSGAVCLWDLKKRTRARQFFHDRYPSNQVLLDPTDRYVLSLSDEIFNIYNLREGTLATSIVAPPSSNYGSFSKLCVSQIEPHVAAIGTKDGSLLLYDIVTAAAISKSNESNNNIMNGKQPSTNTTAPFVSMNHCHSNSITGIAISKTNPQLVASSSLDGTLNFIDIKSNELIHDEIVTTTGGASGHNKSCSITCLSLHSDGVSCAVGTNTGKVVVYDIRKVNGIVAQLQVQNAVTNIQYALPPKNSKLGGVGGGIVSSSSPARPTTITPKSQQQQEYPQQQPQQQYRHHQPQQNQHYESNIDANNQVQGGKKHGARATTATATVHSEYQSTTNLSYQGPDDEKEPPSLQLERQPPAQSQQQQQQRNSNQSTMPEPPQPTIDMGEVRDVVRDEIDNLRDDVEESLRNLHMDMIRQFHIQSQEFNNVLSSHLSTIERLTRENQNLKDEMDRLRKEK